MLKIYFSALLMLLSAGAHAQLTGVKNVPGDYPTLAAAITDLNTSGVGGGGVTINLISGNPQTAPAGGYVIGGSGSALLNTTSTSSRVSIQGNGNTITASASHTIGAINDAIFKLVGADYITIIGFTMQENAANNINTPANSNNMTEFGVALFYASPSDGAQNNIIQGNTISLNRNYRNTFGIYSNTRNTSTDMSTAADITSPSGSNSFNKIYANTINNINFGIVFIGSPTAANMDNGNDVGGSSLSTGNNITNAGSSASALSTYVSMTGAHYIIFSNHQINENISFNTMVSAALTSTITEGGILKNYSAGQPAGTFTTTINNNTITVTNSPSGATGGSVIPINNAGITPLLSTATMSINNNTIQNNNIGGNMATTQSFIGINNGSAVGLMNMNSNLFLNNSITASTSIGEMVGINNGTLASSNNVNINNNIHRGYLNTSPATTLATGDFIAIINNGPVRNTLNINGNILGDALGDLFTKSNGDMFFVDVIEVLAAAAGSTLNINGNSFKGINVRRLSQPGTLDGLMAILTSKNVFSSVINIDNNSIGTDAGNFVNFSGNNTGEIWGILNQGGSASGTVSISSNNFRGFVHDAPGSSNYTFIFNSFGSLLQNINNNTFTNLNLNTTGSAMFIRNFNVSWPANAVSNVNGNRIVGTFTKAAGSSVHFYLSTGSASSTVMETNSNNNFSNVTATGSTFVEGWRNHDSTSNKTISANVFNNITAEVGNVTIVNVDRGTNSVFDNVISNITGQNTINGILLTQNILSSSIYRNNINNLSSSGTAAVNGINVNGVSSTTHDIFKNKIYNLQTTSGTSGTVNGMSVVSGGMINIYNNLIGNLTAPTANSTTDAIRGINITSTQPNSSVKVYYNTIYINATSSGTDFSSSALYQAASATSTTASLDLINNILVNTSVAKGATGKTSVLRRSGTDLSNYATTSNNNLFYAGVPGSVNLLMFDQVNSYETLAALKSAVAPRETNSVSEMPPFLSTDGANSSFLHINFAQPTAVADAGKPITGITDDYDGDPRHSTSPDIGADESVITFPLYVEYFRGSKQNNDILLQWKINVVNSATTLVTLERSSEARSFHGLHSIHTTAERSKNPFEYTDAAPLVGMNYYRLKMVDADGKVSYSRIIPFKVSGLKIYSLMPNPVRNAASLNVTTDEATTITLVISDVTGKQFQKQVIKIPSGKNLIPLQTATLSVGTYQLTVITADEKITTIRFQKQ